MSELKRNKVFQLIGAVPTNPRWSWCAKAPDNKLAVFTLWEDKITTKGHRFSWDDSSQTLSRHGGRDLKKVLELVMANDIPAYGLVCVARDTEAEPRSIKEVRGDYLRCLKIIRRADGIWGVPGKRILIAEFVKNRNQFKQLPSNGLMDLASPPDGCDAPDRAVSVGHTVVRDNKVRAYVVQRADGRCEYCGKEGFCMPGGKKYVEAHHIIGLSNQGRDTVDNVIALCPEHHREAHYGQNAVALEERFVALVAERQNPQARQSDGGNQLSPAPLL